MRDLLRRCLAVLVLVLLAPGAGARAELSTSPEFQQGMRVLEQAHRMPLRRDTGAFREVLEWPVQGDSERLRLATALFVMQSLTVNDASVQALVRHQSRLLAEDALGHPRTRVATVAQVIAFEDQNSASFQRLLTEVFARWVRVELPAQEIVSAFPGGSMPKMEVLVRHAAAPVELTGDFSLRVADAEASQGVWQRGCRLARADDPAWQRQPDGARVARLPCTIHSQREPAQGFARVMERMRSGAAQPEIVPGMLTLLPPRYEDGLPYVQAAQGLVAGGCRAAGTCGTEFRWFLRGQPTGSLVGIAFVLQMAICGALLWRARNAPLGPAGWRPKLGTVYLAIVVAAHVVAIGVAAGPQGGSLLLLMAWAALGIPLFGPGLAVGAFAIRSGLLNRGALYRTGLVLGVLALTLPLLEYVLMNVLKSGYGGG